MRVTQRWKSMKGARTAAGLLFIGMLCGCEKITEAEGGIEIAPEKTVFKSVEYVSVSVRNTSDHLFFFANYSELDLRQSPDWRTISVGGCVFGEGRWLILLPSQSRVCRHGTASTYSSGDYRLKLVVRQDTLLPSSGKVFIESPIFRLGN